MTERSVPKMIKTSIYAEGRGSIISITSVLEPPALEDKRTYRKIFLVWKGFKKMALFADIHMKGIYRSFLLWQSTHESSAQSAGLNYGQCSVLPKDSKSDS